MSLLSHLDAFGAEGIWKVWKQNIARIAEAENTFIHKEEPCMTIVPWQHPYIGLNMPEDRNMEHSMPGKWQIF